MACASSASHLVRLRHQRSSRGMLLTPLLLWCWFCGWTGRRRRCGAAAHRRTTAHVQHAAAAEPRTSSGAKQVQVAVQVGRKQQGAGAAGGRARPRVWRGEVVAANRRWLPWCSMDGTATREAGGSVHGHEGNVSMARVQASLHSWRWIGGTTPPTRKSTTLSRRGIS